MQINLGSFYASGDGLVITNILVPGKGGLRLWRASRRTRLGSVELRLSPQSHGLLLALAEKVLDCGNHIDTETLRSDFFSKREDPKAVNQGTRLGKRTFGAEGFGDLGRRFDQPDGRHCCNPVGQVGEKLNRRPKRSSSCARLCPGRSQRPSPANRIAIGNDQIRSARPK